MYKSVFALIFFFCQAIWMPSIAMLPVGSPDEHEDADDQSFRFKSLEVLDRIIEELEIRPRKGKADSTQISGRSESDTPSQQ